MNDAATAPLWQKLQAMQGELKQKSLHALFEEDNGRFAAFSLTDEDLLLDFSKTRTSRATLSLLLELAAAAGVEARRDAMFAGERINVTEKRPVLHVALRNRSNRPILVDGKDVMPEVNEVLGRMSRFSEALRSGAARPARGGRFTDVINIGIGGSDLGPAMATLALAPYHDGPRAHFVSNIDGAHWHDTARNLDPATTLIIVASKTFTTVETMTNALTARRWLVEALGEKAVSDHFVAVSTALDKVKAFGIAEDRVFGFWDWVGGRYSVWSAIGLPLMLAIGPKRFEEFLSGAHAMDEHFRLRPAASNMPMLLGLIGIWHRDVCGYPARAVLPYDQRLARFPAYLQQLDMESNGKHVTLDGRQVAHPTGPLVWGEPGTNGQHAFYQLLHQGTDIIPCEFWIAAKGHEPELAEHQALLMANCLAQSRALMLGRTTEEAKAQLLAHDASAEEANRLAPHKTFVGERPSITTAYHELDPFALGRLIALYEHRVFVEAAIFGTNAFDQWGVELGKELATTLLPMVKGEKPPQGDASTIGLMRHLASLGRRK
ncbi:MAG TPA: glucose-6-phosphate isomerase [Beijerinckiaceae bacterium]|jgi:glucose-6-phosphate isomerase|nr:glucose-6-phosphate isomerase [Beijerinckiaceae bacterium]